MRGTDFEFDWMREEREKVKPSPHSTSTPRPVTFFIPPEKKKPLPPIDPSSRWGLIGWYNDESELARELDTFYGPGKWRLAGGGIEYESSPGIFSSYYACQYFKSGRIYVYDESME